MPTCCDCGKEVPKAGFAKSQLKKSADKRRCKGCAESLAGSGPCAADDSQSSRSGNHDASPHTCWICLCSDSDDHGAPRRDCSCRGTSGYVHMSCLIDMASKRSDEINMNDDSITVGVSVGGNVLNPWRECTTCRQVYCGETIYVLAKAMEAKYDKESAHKFWKNAAYDNLSGVLAERGDMAGAMVFLEKRLKLARAEYFAELQSGVKRCDIKATRALVNIHVNLAEGMTRVRIGSPEAVKAIIDEAERYAQEIRPTDGGYACATVWRQRALFEHEVGDDDCAYQFMQKAMPILMRDPGFASSLNGIRAQWSLADMMLLANGGGKAFESYELKEETLTKAQRVLGKDHPYVLKLETELDGFRDRMGEEWISFGKAFHGKDLVNSTSSDETIATGFCYTGQKAKIMGVTEDGYRGLLGEMDGSWTASYIPFQAVCLDKGTCIILHAFSGSSIRKRLNGKSGIVQGYEIIGRNFDTLKLLVDVEGIEGQMKVKPENVMVQQR